MKRMGRLNRRAWRNFRLDGPGRMRYRIAEMLEKQLGIKVDPFNIGCNNSPADRLRDLCRWCVDGVNSEGAHVHVCSWDRMTDIIKSGSFGVVDDDNLHFEVCRGPLK